MTIIFIAVVLLVLALAVGAVIYHKIPPRFSASVSKLPSGEYAITLKPNFRVNRMKLVTITGLPGLSSRKEESQSGVQTITLSGPLASGTQLKIACHLQYAQWVAACSTVGEQSVVLP